MIWQEHVSRAGETSNSYKILVRKPEENEPIWRLKHKWDDVDMFCGIFNDSAIISDYMALNGGMTGE
jgi:hypothetical protein